MILFQNRIINNPAPLQLLLLLVCYYSKTQAKCRDGCVLALASYNVWEGSNLTYISNIFDQSITEILRYNPSIPNPDTILDDSRIEIPFSCDCLNGDFLGHTFNYVALSGDTYDKIAKSSFANLTNKDWVQRVNIYDATEIPAGAPLNVTINCSCGDRHVSKDYGLFQTYPLRPGQNLSSLATESGIPAELLERYNLGFNFSAGSGIVYVPSKDQNGFYPPLVTSPDGISGRAIAGISAAGVAVALLVSVCVCVGIDRRRKKVDASLALEIAEGHRILQGHGSRRAREKKSETTALVNSQGGMGRITVDKSVEFSYQELAKATNGFNSDNMIGQGGFGSVYYAELRGEKVAIKKMDMQASKQFLAELKILTHVHHLNLVRLIGYCVERSLFLVYEFIENGNLGHHLSGSGRDPLPWSTRVQIALDAARGLEYIHEHTVPVYTHRDIKSSNILLDKNFRGKVGDFGLTKLTEVASASLQNTRLVGTFGYMSPEYAQYGEVSPKMDVYAFGVVLLELISGMEAVVKTNEVITECKGLVCLFQDVLSQPNPMKDLQNLIDPRLRESCPLDSIRKMALLAKACTQDSPQLRPSMRSIVVALMTLSSSSEDWDVDLFHENQAPLNLTSGR